VTTEQLIVMGFIAGAFVIGWLARASIEWAGRRRRRTQAEVTLSAGVPRHEELASDTREELDRAIRAYNAAVGLQLKDGESSIESGKGALEILASSLYALSLSVRHASTEVSQDHPLARTLRDSGSELRRLAQDVLLYTSEPEVPNGVLDQLEQELMSAASVLLTPVRAPAQAPAASGS
jgi:hypothetical protein